MPRRSSRAQQTLEDAQDFYRDLKARTAALGRDPSTIKILPGIVPVIGSTVEEAARLERQLDELIMPPVLPSGLTVFVDQVIPILQARGLFRTEYTGTTLRDHYGLARPAGRSPLLQETTG